MSGVDINEDAATWQDDGTQSRRDMTVQICTWALVVLAGVLSFVPGLNPAVLSVIGLGPWALLLMVFLGNGRYLLLGKDGHTVVIGVIVLPVILGMGAMLRFPMIDWRPPLGIAIGMAAGYTLLAVMADASAQAARPTAPSDKRRGVWIALLLNGGFLGWATLINLNAGGASLPPEAHPVTIARQWISGGRTRTNYFIFVDPPALGITDFQVDTALYYKSAPGDRVCLVIHTGMLGWRWYEVRDRSNCGDATWAGAVH